MEYRQSRYVGKRACRQVIVLAYRANVRVAVVGIKYRIGVRAVAIVGIPYFRDILRMDAKRETQSDGLY